jgi:hypothetical protein
MKNLKFITKLVQPWIELGTSCVWDKNDNHYSSEPYENCFDVIVFNC